MRMWIYVLKWGCGEGFYGGVGEHNLIKMVKNPGQNTQRKTDCFSTQVATRFYETKILELAWECVKMQLVLHTDMCIEKPENLVELEGLHIILFNAEYQQKRKFSVTWKSPHRNLAKQKSNELMRYAIGNQMKGFKYKEDFFIEAFTCLKLSIGSPEKARLIF